MELAQDRVQWQALVLAVLNLLVLLLGRALCRERVYRVVGCAVGGGRGSGRLGACTGILMFFFFCVLCFSSH
jgi:hypothetical protein